MKRFFSVFALFAALSAVLSAPLRAAESDLSIETSVSASRVELGGQITLDIIISNAPGKIASPTIGTLDGFTAYSQGHSQEISIVNGRMSSRNVFSYVLVAHSVGKKSVGPFQLTVDGKPFKVAPVQVEVVPGDPSPSPAGPAAYTWTGQASPPQGAPARSVPGDVSDEDIFVQVRPDKSEVYVNEPIMLTYTFFTRLPATYKGFEKEPVTTGFWVEDFPPEKTIRRQQKFINGSRYVVADVRKIALFPTEAGVFTFEPGVLAADVEIRQNDSFDDFFSNNIFGARRFSAPLLSQIVSKKLALAPVTLTVKALPAEGRPAGFTGAVGNYLMEGSVDKNEVQAGDPITYRVRVWGRGNINTLTMPEAPKLPDFKVYDASASTNVSKEKLIVEGEKVAETVMVPKNPGTYTLPPVSFSYFDPDDKTYKLMKTEPQTIKVTGSAQADEPSAALTSTASSGLEPEEKKDVAVLSHDIRFIKTQPAPRSIGGLDLWRKPLYWLAVLIFGAGWIVLGVLASVRREDGLSGLKDAKFRRSHAIARQKLKGARSLMRVEKQDEFYAEISRAVYGYFGDKLGMSPSAVSLPVIESRTGDELSSELFSDTKKLFDELSAGRFARSSKSKEDMHELYALADRVITFFEKVKLK